MDEMTWKPAGSPSLQSYRPECSQQTKLGYAFGFWIATNLTVTTSRYREGVFRMPNQRTRHETKRDREAPLDVPRKLLQTLQLVTAVAGLLKYTPQRWLDRLHDLVTHLP